MSWQDQKRFMDEMILRFEKAFRSVDESMTSHTRENTEALRKLQREIDEHRAEFRAEYRAHRQALLHILDRLANLSDGGSAPAA
jgi:Na+/phosphate symporter